MTRAWSSRPYPIPPSAAAQARAHAQSRPDDDRLAVLAETLAALVGPGRAPLRWMVCFPQYALLVRAALCSVILLAVPAFRCNDWAWLSVVVVFAPGLLLGTVLRRARDRAAARPAVAQAEPTDVLSLPVLPPVPMPSRSETTVSLVALAALLAAAVGSGVWSYQQYAAYPRYTVAAPDRLRGYERLDGTAVQQLMDGVLSETMVAGSDATSFTYVYGKTEKQVAVSAIVVVGQVGDFHEMTPDTLGTLLGDMQSGLMSTASTTGKPWSADPGRLGGSMRCLPYQTMAGESLYGCTWGDKGSVGAVFMPDAGEGREGAADLTRAVREAVLHQGSPDSLA